MSLFVLTDEHGYYSAGSWIRFLYQIWQGNCFPHILGHSLNGAKQQTNVARIPLSLSPFFLFFPFFLWNLVDRKFTRLLSSDEGKIEANCCCTDVQQQFPPKFLWEYHKSLLVCGCAIRGGLLKKLLLYLNSLDLLTGCGLYRPGRFAQTQGEWNQEEVVHVDDWNNWCGSRRQWDNMVWRKGA